MKVLRNGKAVEKVAPPAVDISSEDIREAAAKAIIDRLWSVLGGDQAGAELWHEISDAVTRGFASALPLPEPTPDPRDATIARLSADLDAARDQFKCKARPGLPAGPQDCEWPQCGCDPAANRVLAHLQECGFTIVDEATIGVALTEARDALEPFAEVARPSCPRGREHGPRHALDP